MILSSDDGQKKVFPDVPMTGFKNNKNLKAHLVRPQLPDLDEVGRSNSAEERALLFIYVKIWKTHAHSKLNT